MLLASGYREAPQSTWDMLLKKYVPRWKEEPSKMGEDINGPSSVGGFDD